MEESRIMKRVNDSKTEQIQILMPVHINGSKRLFGGKLMEWIDVVAAVTARRHCNLDVTTVAVDNLQFKSAAYVNSTIILIGQITYVGNTSMEVRVETFVEALSGERVLINKAYLVMVALDTADHPCKVPGLLLQTEEEKADWQAGEKRHLLRKQRRTENY